MFTREELDNITEICTRNGAYIVADAAYERILYDGLEHQSMARVQQDNIISVFTFSRTFAMTGWRLGYVVTRHQPIARLPRHGHYTQPPRVTTVVQ